MITTEQGTAGVDIGDPTTALCCAKWTYLINSINSLRGSIPVDKVFKYMPHTIHPIIDSMCWTP